MATTSKPVAREDYNRNVTSDETSPSGALLVPLQTSLPFGSQNNYGIGNTKEFNKAIDKCLELIRNEADLYESSANPKDGSELASLLSAGADIFKGLACLEEAKQLLTEALSLRRKLAVESVADLAYCLNDYGVLLLEMHRYTDAIEALQESRELFVREHKGAANHEGIAATYGNEAIARRYLRNFSEATSAHEEAMLIFQELSGKQSEDFLYQKGQLGITLGIAGDYHMAKKMLTEVLSFFPEQNIHTAYFRYELTHLIPNN